MNGEGGCCSFPLSLDRWIADAHFTFISETFLRSSVANYALSESSSLIVVVTCAPLWPLRPTKQCWNWLRKRYRMKWLNKLLNLQSQLGISQISSCELKPSHSLSLTKSPFVETHLRYRTRRPIPHVTLHAEKSVQQPHEAFCAISAIRWHPSTEQFLLSSLKREIFRFDGSAIWALHE